MLGESARRERAARIRTRGHSVEHVPRRRREHASRVNADVGSNDGKTIGIIAVSAGVASGVVGLYLLMMTSFRASFANIDGSDHVDVFDYPSGRNGAYLAVAGATTALVGASIAFSNRTHLTFRESGARLPLGRGMALGLNGLSF